MHELLNVIVNTTPLLDGSHNRREVVIGEHHVRGFLGDGSAREPHRDPDIRCLDGRSIVDAVAGHSHHIPMMLQSFHYAEFVLGRHPRINGRSLHGRGKAILRHTIQFGSCHNAARCICDAQFSRNGQCRCWVVARDHDGANPGRLALSYRFGRLIPRRIDHPHQPHVDQVAFFERWLSTRWIHCWQCTPRQREYSQCAIGHCRTRGEQLRATFVAHGRNPTVTLFRDAPCEHRLRGTFRKHDSHAVGTSHDNAHPLPLRVEWDLEDHRLSRIAGSNAGFHRGHDQRTLGGIADDFPCTVIGWLHRGVIATRGDGEQEAEVGVGFRMHR